MAAPTAALGGVDSSECVIESAHPYDDNADVYTPVRIPGATKLLISFDADTVTEKDCDYVVFYKDDAHSGVWGADKYHGNGATGNWPGLGGRPPLEVPGDSFVFHFKSDGSTTRWGYLARVRVAAPATACVRVISSTPVFDAVRARTVCGYLACATFTCGCAVVRLGIPVAVGRRGTREDVAGYDVPRVCRDVAACKRWRRVVGVCVHGGRLLRRRVHAVRFRHEAHHEQLIQNIPAVLGPELAAGLCCHG